ncbi:hypothetical protein CBF23_004080 [Marinomonas agarivorans]|nr:hypothetical protein CBF23_004080 [Marinomonas agarivorans]
MEVFALLAKTGKRILNEDLVMRFITLFAGVLATSAAMSATASQPPSEPGALLSIGPKTFTFTWQQDPRASYYQLLENRDGFSGYYPVGRPVDRDEESIRLVDIPLYDRINASYILQACNSAGCTDSGEIQVDKALLVNGIVAIQPEDTGEQTIGHAVAISSNGKTLALSTFDKAYNNEKIYIFNQQETGQWQRTATIPKFAVPGEKGYAAKLALDSTGTNLLVAREDGVQVFKEKRLGLWGPVRTIKAGGIKFSDIQALSIAATPDVSTVIFGIASKVPEQKSFVYVSERGAAQNFDGFSSPEYQFRSGFGSTVSISADGNTIAVGAPNFDLEAPSRPGLTIRDSGVVYIFKRPDTGWSPSVKDEFTRLTPSYIDTGFGTGGYNFGNSVSLSADGRTVAVGAFRESANATGINPFTLDYFALDSGAAYVFDQNYLGQWQETAYIKASNSKRFDRFGSKVSLTEDGNMLAVSAPFEDSPSLGLNSSQEQGTNTELDTGAVYIFKRPRRSQGWQQTSYVKPKTSDVRLFGRDLELSQDGDSLIVGGKNSVSLY